MEQKIYRFDYEVRIRGSLRGVNRALVERQVLDGMCFTPRFHDSQTDFTVTVEMDAFDELRSTLQ